jgi:cytochrome bd ubiquinol oxidase subunit II
MDLPLLLGLVVAFGIAMYVVMDGFDLGVGVLFPFAPSDADRDLMMNSIAPIWDGNETWLVLGGTLLIAAFPVAYAVLLPAFYVPLVLMLFALIFRGLAFEFRFRARRFRHVWDWAFSGGSTLAGFCQGVILGAFLGGIPVHNCAFSGGTFHFLSAFAVVCGLGLIAGYVLLGATWRSSKRPGRRAASAVGPLGPRFLSASPSSPSSACGRPSPTPRSRSAGSAGRISAYCGRYRS